MYLGYKLQTFLKSGQTGHKENIQIFYSRLQEGGEILKIQSGQSFVGHPVYDKL
jgi:hypothetical protein